MIVQNLFIGHAIFFAIIAHHVLYEARIVLRLPVKESFDTECDSQLILMKINTFIGVEDIGILMKCNRRIVADNQVYELNTAV